MTCSEADIPVTRSFYFACRCLCETIFILTYLHVVFIMFAVVYVTRSLYSLHVMCITFTGVYGSVLDINILTCCVNYVGMCLCFQLFTLT